METYALSHLVCDSVLPLPCSWTTIWSTISESNSLPVLHECKFDGPTVLVFCILLVTSQAQARFFSKTLQDSCWGQGHCNLKRRNVFLLLFLDSFPSVVPYYLFNRIFLYLTFCFNKNIQPEIAKMAVTLLFPPIVLSYRKTLCCDLKSLGCSKLCTHSKWINNLSQCASEYWEHMFVELYFFLCALLLQLSKG